MDLNVFLNAQRFFYVSLSCLSYNIRKNNRSNGDDDTNFKSDNSGEWVNDGQRTPTTVRKFNRVSAGGKKPLHPTEKPISLMTWLVESYSNEGDTILDFTMGSGTTGIACLKTNRNFIGIEKDDKYFDIAQNRIKNCTLY